METALITVVNMEQERPRIISSIIYDKESDILPDQIVISAWEADRTTKKRLVIEFSDEGRSCVVKTVTARECVVSSPFPTPNDLRQGFIWLRDEA